MAASVWKDFLDNLKRIEQQSKEQVEVYRKLGDGMASFNRAAANATLGIAAAGAALLKFQHAANPQLLGAFHTQLTLLQAKIGNQLLPVFSQLMEGVDDVIGWFDGLSEGQKKLVAGVAVGLPLVIGFGRAVMALGPAFRIAQASLETLRSSASAHPYLAAAGKTVLSVTIAAAIVEALRGIQGPQGRPLFGRSAPGEGEGKTSQEEMDFATQIINGTHGNMQRGTLAEMQAQAKEQAARLRNLERSGERNFFSANGGWMRLQEGDAGRAAQILERFSAEGFVGNDEKRLKGRAASLSRQLHAASMGQQPQYLSSAADLFKHNQLQMLGKNAWEQDLLQVNRQQREILERDLNKVVEELRALRAKTGAQ